MSKTDQAIKRGAQGAALGSLGGPGWGTALGGGLGLAYGYLEGDRAEEAANELGDQHREASLRYAKHRPEAMAARRQSLQAAMALFNPLIQRTQQMTGAAPPDISGMFAPMEQYEQGLRQDYADRPPSGVGEVEQPSAVERGLSDAGDAAKKYGKYIFPVHALANAPLIGKLF